MRRRTIIAMSQSVKRRAMPSFCVGTRNPVATDGKLAATDRGLVLQYRLIALLHARYPPF